MGLRRGTGAWLGPRPGCLSSLTSCTRPTWSPRSRACPPRAYLPERSAIRRQQPAGQRQR